MTEQTNLIAVQSKIFGPFQVEEGSVMHFSQGIPGLETVKEYAMIQIEEYHPIVWMVSTNGVFHFPLVDYKTIDSSDLDTASIERYKALLDSYMERNQDSIAYVILKLDKAVSKVSLKAPIVINPQLKKGQQLVLEQS